MRTKEERKRRSIRAVTLVESVVAAALVGICLVVVLSAFFMGRVMIGNIQFRLAAMRVAEQQLEYYMVAPDAEVAAHVGTHTDTIPVGSWSATRTVVVTACDLNGDGTDDSYNVQIAISRPGSAGATVEVATYKSSEGLATIIGGFDLDNPTPLPSETSTPTSTATLTPTATSTPTSTGTVTPSETPSETPMAYCPYCCNPIYPGEEYLHGIGICVSGPSETPMPTETFWPSETPMPTETLYPTPTETVPMPTETFWPSETPSETPMPTETLYPTPTETVPMPTETLYPTPTETVPMPTETLYPTPTETTPPTTMPPSSMPPTTTPPPTMPPSSMPPG